MYMYIAKLCIVYNYFIHNDINKSLTCSLISVVLLAFILIYFLPYDDPSLALTFILTREIQGLMTLLFLFSTSNIKCSV